MLTSSLIYVIIKHITNSERGYSMNLRRGWRNLKINECPSDFNCIMFAVGNSKIADTFQKYCNNAREAEKAFEKACRDLHIKIKKVSTEEAMKTKEYVICLFVWETDPDNYRAMFPYEYHVYRRAPGEEWLSKKGFGGRIVTPSDRQIQTIQNPKNDPERTFFVLK